MTTSLANRYSKTQTSYTDYVSKTCAAYDVVLANSVETDSLNKDGIAGINTTQLALAVANNKSNIMKAAHNIQSILFDIRQTAVAYCYDPDEDVEVFTMPDNTVMTHKQGVWK